MANDREEQGKKMGEVIKKAWEDELFMARLLEDATTVLAEEGIQMPEGMKVKAVQNVEKLTYFVVPQEPSSAMSDTELDDLAGGTSWCRYEFGQSCNAMSCDRDNVGIRLV